MATDATAVKRQILERRHRATQSAPSGVALAGPGATWHHLNEPNADAAIAFINAPPAQVAGEAVFADNPNGTVDLYYFL
jgi:hypothetical protein